MEILFAERVVDQEFETERHNDVEQRLDHKAYADIGDHPPVIAEERPDEADDGRHRAGGLARGKDDEILVIVVVIHHRLCGRGIWLRHHALG